MRVSVDRSLCVAHGQCEYNDPEHFTVNDDGILELDENPPDSARGRTCCARCQRARLAHCLRKPDTPQPRCALAAALAAMLFSRAAAQSSSLSDVSPAKVPGPASI